MRRRASRLPFAVISINPDAPVPLYRQLYDEFRAAILEGRLKAGNKLPPTRELANELGISRNTVMAAYDQLTSEGYIEGRVGSGAWVTGTLPEEMLQSRPIQARRGCFIGNAMSELAGRCPETAARACGTMAAVEEALYWALLRGKKNGEIKNGRDLRAVARFLYSSLQGLQLMAKATQDRKTLEDVVKVTLSVLD